MLLMRLILLLLHSILSCAVIASVSLDVTTFDINPFRVLGTAHIYVSSINI